MHRWQVFRKEKIMEMSRRCSSVLDFGRSLHEPEKQLFEGKSYATCDVDPSIHPDILGDICDLSMVADETYDGIFCCSILEHVYNPFLAVKEMFRILQQGGSVFGYLPFLHTYHAKTGHYEDYYRFTEAGVKYLFKDFERIELAPVRGNVTSWLHQLPGKLNNIQHIFYWADRFFSDKQVTGFYMYVRK